MLTMKRVVGPLSLAAAGLFLAVAVGNAATTSDQPAAILIYPKIVVNNEGPLTDTIIEIANTNVNPVDLHCFYVNATSHCSNTGLPCDSGLDCVGASPGACVPGWGETDFHVALTQNQPFYWTASAGRNRTCANNDPATCEPLPLIGIGVCQGGSPLCTQNADCGIGGTCLFNGQSNAGTSVPPVPEDITFVGELKCVVVSEQGGPEINSNLIYGTATIVTGGGGPVDAQSYNAVGIRSRTGFCSAPAFPDLVFCDTDSECGAAVCVKLGGPADWEFGRVLTLGPSEEIRILYQSCPETLILDHIFDGAPDPITPIVDDPLAGGFFYTDLTLVPCSEDFATGTANLGRSTAQFLVFNEFEQRFSSTLPVTCFDERLLSNIDTRNNGRSIFSVNVSGTIAGQTRIRAVGSGLIGVARAMKSFIPIDILAEQASFVGLPPVFAPGAAYELHQQGDRTAADEIILP